MTYEQLAELIRHMPPESRRSEVVVEIRVPQLAGKTLMTGDLGAITYGPEGQVSLVGNKRD